MQTSIKPPVVFFWAIVRLILGVAQVTGAIILAVCLYRYGAGRETVIVLSITMGVAILSIVLFRLLVVQGSSKP